MCSHSPDTLSDISRWHVSTSQAAYMHGSQGMIDLKAEERSKFHLCRRLRHKAHLLQILAQKLDDRIAWLLVQASRERPFKFPRYGLSQGWKQNNQQLEQAKCALPAIYEIGLGDARLMVWRLCSHIVRRLR